MGKRIVSIDAGSRNIHVLQASRKGKSLKVRKAFSFPTPPNSVVDGKIEDKYALKDSVRTHLVNNRVRTKPTVMTVQGTSVIIRDLTLPVAKEEQLAGAVAYEMEQYVSVDGKNNITEFRVVDEVVEDGVAKNKIKVASMPREAVEGYYKFLKEVRLKPSVLDVHSNSVAKLFSKQLEVNGTAYMPQGSVALVDFGYKTTLINIITDGVLEFSRLMSYGSRDMDLIIANYYNLTPSEAEARKMEEIDMSMIESGIEDPDSIYASLRPSVTQLTRELQKVIQYYASRSTGNSIETMFIFGGGSRMKGFVSYLKQMLGLNEVVRIESISGPELVIEAENIEMDDYINALGAMIRI